MSKGPEIAMGKRRLTLSNLDKVLYPEVGFTKGQVVDYYIRISQWLLPHLRNKPLTLKRYPNGVEGQYFYEKNCPKHRPDWVKTAPVWSEGRGRTIDFCLANDLPTLVWAANLADLELHASLSLASRLERPTVLAFDLDPGEPATIVECCEVALMLRDLFAEFGMECFPKTSGSKGMQVYVPLNTATDYDETKSFARSVAELLEREHPKLVVSNMRKALRKGKVFVDWSQNDEHKTTVCVYSLRAKSRPTVSTPLRWKEVEKGAGATPEHLVFTAEEAIERAEKHGDLFEPVLSLKQRLPKLQ